LLDRKTLRPEVLPHGIADFRANDGLSAALTCVG
jgi:hypothetical protein